MRQCRGETEAKHAQTSACMCRTAHACRRVEGRKQSGLSAGCLFCCRPINCSLIGSATCGWVALEHSECPSSWQLARGCSFSMQDTSHATKLRRRSKANEISLRQQPESMKYGYVAANHSKWTHVCKLHHPRCMLPGLMFGLSRSIVGQCLCWQQLGELGQVRC